MKNDKLIFGIYPGAALGTINGILEPGIPDDQEKIKNAIKQLHGGNKDFLVRCYLHYVDSDIPANQHPNNPLQYVNDNCKLDLVIGYQSKNGNIDEWIKFITEQIKLYGPYLAKIQIAEEPNLKNIPDIDGDSPNIYEAVVEGIIAAKQAALANGYTFKVGFNCVPALYPDNDFWRRINELNSKQFADALDYVGLDFFPDVFRPVSLENMENSVNYILNHFRNVNLASAQIPFHVPIHITENGMPTTSTRSETEQRDKIEKIIRSINSSKEKYNITHYELFSLRDADSDGEDLFHQFGILKDNYTPKMSFEMYKNIITELG